jgi:hypothetical protein
MQTKLNISTIKELCNQNPDCYFFSKDTMRFYRHARAQYKVSYINGINYVIVSKHLPETNIYQVSEYELREKGGRYNLHWIETLPEKISKTAQSTEV